MNVILCALASSILAISLSPSALAEGEGTTAEPTTYSFVGNADLHHVRFPDTDQGNYGLERNAVGVNWADGTGNFVALDDVNASWVRLLVNADKGGSYEIPIKYKAGAYPIRVFVNSASSFKEFNLPDGGWGVVTNAITLLDGIDGTRKEHVFGKLTIQTGHENVTGVRNRTRDGKSLVGADAEIRFEFGLDGFG